MTFWELPFGTEVEAPDSALQELEALARNCAGTRWEMEFAGTAMHFRFSRKKDLSKFIRSCTRKYRIFIPGSRRWLCR
jgi:hypothetical protein